MINKTKVSTFLKERLDRFKPAEANKLGLNRLNKIDFSGKIHLVEKPTNTNMILIKSGDLVISGINVEKGAVAVYQGDEDITATIHYSSYEFNENKINVEYFKWFLKSKIFRDIVNSQIGGGIKTELKSKKFLPLEIDLPNIKIQKQILKKIQSMEKEIKQLENNVSHDEGLLSKLKQSILSEAVRGKLVPQNSKDEPASELLKKIKKEKEKLIKEGKIKKGKELPVIEDDEIPYELPKGWVWTRLEDICKIGTGATPNTKNQEYYNGTINWATSASTNKLFIENTEKTITEKAIKETNCKIYPKGTLIIAMYGQGKTRGQISELNIKSATNQACATLSLNGIAKETKNYIKLFFQKSYNEIRKLAEGGAQPNLNLMKIKKTLVPLPPIDEQKRIVSKVDSLMGFCDGLGLKIKENKKSSDRLMGAVLGKVFGR